jgi:hypothetical protein
MLDALERQFGDGPDTGRRVDEDCEYGAIAEADLGRDINRLEEPGDLVRPDLRRLPFENGIPLGSNGGGRVDDDHVAVDQPVEELPLRRQMELLGRDGQRQFLKVGADVAWSDANQLQVAFLAPRQELLNSMDVVLAGMGVSEFALEEFLPGKFGSLADTFHDVGCVPS